MNNAKSFVFYIFWKNYGIMDNVHREGFGNETSYKKDRQIYNIVSRR